jgi:hypothetical protein
MPRSLSNRDPPELGSLRSRIHTAAGSTCSTCNVYGQQHGMHCVKAGAVVSYFDGMDDIYKLCNNLLIHTLLLGIALVY